MSRNLEQSESAGGSLGKICIKIYTSKLRNISHGHGCIACARLSKSSEAVKTSHVKIKVRQDGQQKRANCFATLLQSELNTHLPRKHECEA